MQSAAIDRSCWIEIAQSQRTARSIELDTNLIQRHTSVLEFADFQFSPANFVRTGPFADAMYLQPDKTARV